MARKSLYITSSVCVLVFLMPRPAALNQSGKWTGDKAKASSYRVSGGVPCSKGSNRETGLAGADSCADPIDRCQKPIKYLGSQGACACFACEYGKATQHNICTQNKHDKATLLGESGPN